uniref:RNB domain-containing protein n=1 Tax=viral metagenome TaxID=1070528 RepID=A0A6C0E5X0_9ZZZZ
MSKIYQIKINSRTYDEWYYTDLLQNKVDIHYDPISHKLFNNDIVMEVLCDTSITAIQTQRIKVVDSVISKNKNIPGILILKENKTYGRLERKDTLDLSGSAIKKTPGKLLYKCIPDDKTLPPFLIPYEFKYSNFSKLYSNLYVTFSLSKWGEKDKHPIGVLTNVIGEVNNSNIDIYYSYQLMCKNLNISIEQFNKALFNSIKTRFDSTTVDLNKITNEFISSQYPELENRTDQKEWNIFTIDSVNTTDYDDAFSIKKMGSSETSETYMLSIYISNVALWLELFGLWDVFSNRVSSIYLPDKKITMLPTLMSSNLCSLIENAHRYAFTMDITINVITYDSTNEKDIMIENIEFKNTIVSVSHNYSYQQEELISNSNYNSLFDVTKLLSEKYVCQYDITDSNHMVAYLMILMNYYSAKNLKKNNTGILLKNNITTMQKSFELGLGLQNKPNNFVKSWYLSKSEYFGVMNKIDTTSNSHNAFKHESLQLDAYTHITSPIRRIVDLLNLIEMQQIHDLFTFSKEARQFYNKWTSEDNILFINTNMKSIRKLQNECILLDMYNNIPEIIEKTFNGIIIDIKNKNCLNKPNPLVYVVYIPELKITCKITKQTIKNYELYDQIKCNLYMFPDEYNIKQKIRLEEVYDM